MLWILGGIVIVVAFSVFLRKWSRKTPAQFVTFTAITHDDPNDGPPGHSLVTGLLHGLRNEGFSAAEEDNWRDCGWSIDVTQSGAIVEVVCATYDDPDVWMCMISVLNDTSPIAQVFGKKFVDRSEIVLLVARGVHRCLQDAKCTEIRWCVGNCPTAENSTAEPELSRT